MLKVFVWIADAIRAVTDFLGCSVCVTVFFATARAVTVLFDAILAFAVRTESDMMVAR